YLARAFDRDDAVIDLAREEAQRKAHHAAGMSGKALDRQMGFAGVRGAKDGLDRMGRGRWHVLVKRCWHGRPCGATADRRAAAFSARTARRRSRRVNVPGPRFAAAKSAILRV